MLCEFYGQFYVTKWLSTKDTFAPFGRQGFAEDLWENVVRGIYEGYLFGCWKKGGKRERVSIFIASEIRIVFWQELRLASLFWQL